MENQRDFEQDLASIRHLMERSVKFISLSGLAGILSGIYALAGATIVYFRIQFPASLYDSRMDFLVDHGMLPELLGIGLAVLAASLGTGLYLSSKKAKKMGVNVWDGAGRRLMINLAVPLFTGGIFALILMFGGYPLMVAPVCLIFYGLALVNASPNLFDEIRYLGYSEILLGLLAAWLSGFGLLFWAIGFGVLHIVYGTLMYRKYDL